MNKMFFSLISIALLSACASQEAKETSKATQEAQPLAQKPAETPAETKLAAPQSMAINPLRDPGNILSKRSIYYDFDKSNIKDEYRPLVEAHAGYLTDHRSTRVTIQGNCDERGSREYNLALGQRRADGVKKAMSLLGDAPSQIETVSFGKEKPKCTEQNESCWSQNRRSDIVYQGE
jgi:peptidoglycan-associated lipoprotein